MICQCKPDCGVDFEPTRKHQKYAPGHFWAHHNGKAPVVRANQRIVTTRPRDKGRKRKRYAYIVICYGKFSGRIGNAFTKALYAEAFLEEVRQRPCVTGAWIARLEMIDHAI